MPGVQGESGKQGSKGLPGNAGTPGFPGEKELKKKWINIKTNTVKYDRGHDSESEHMNNGRRH